MERRILENIMHVQKNIDEPKIDLVVIPQDYSYH